MAAVYKDCIPSDTKVQMPYIFPHSQLYKIIINLGKIFCVWLRKNQQSTICYRQPLTVRHEGPSIMPGATNVKIQAHRLSIWKIERRTKSIYWTHCVLDRYQIIYSQKKLVWNQSTREFGSNLPIAGRPTAIHPL